MAFERNTARLAEAIERSRQRIAERELRIARLEEIGANTWVLREALTTARQNLELLEFLHKLAQSYAALAAAQYADLVARAGIALPPAGTERDRG